MKKSIRSLGLILAISAYFTLFAAFQLSFAQELASATIVPDRESRVYEAGENAVFTVSALDANGRLVRDGKMTVVFTNDGRDVLAKIDCDLAATNPLEWTTTLPFPGFIKVSARATSSDGRTAKDALVGVAFSPEKIQLAEPKPDDFDEFWAKGRAEIDAIPMDFQQKKLDAFSNDARDVYEISFATVDDRRVYGFYGVPKGAGPFPALVNIAWAGPGLGPDPESVDQGFAVLTLNVFPYSCPIDEVERQRAYDEYVEKLGVDYCLWNVGDRDKYFYRAVILGFDRAIDWFVDQPFVDQSRVGYHGTSQGGGLGLVMAGFNGRLTDVFTSVPALCDLSGQETGRCSGWPRAIDQANGDSAVASAIRYFDAGYFAQNIDVPIVVTLGFVDEICAPSSVCAAFNAIPSKNKRLVFGLDSGHVPPPRYLEILGELKERLLKK